MTALVWFRDDLRLGDNPALHAAAVRPLVALYVYEDHLRPPVGAAGWWLSRSLKALAQSLAAQGVPLIIRRGDAQAHVLEVAAAIDAAEIHWNRRYEPRSVAVDKAIKAQLGDKAHSHHANLLREPWTIKNGAGHPFKVFTPFWKAHRAMGQPRAPLPVPSLTGWKGSASSLAIDDLALEPQRPDWAQGFRDHWEPGEDCARAALFRFLDAALPHYSDERDRPDHASTSRLSPHLRFGEISPFQIWQALEIATEGESNRNSAKFASELGWREFSSSLLFHSADLAATNINSAFDAFPWQHSAEHLAAWQQGQTGYPLVDAGMRELWQTGFMHNRVRMVAASFLVKHLLIDWRHGESWFWDCLVDADSANNPASWQWVAGCGADAAPYYRIFNPVLQGETYDPHGTYVRRFVPELANLPDKFIHQPWQAPDNVLDEAGVSLGNTYPYPIIEHGFARALALLAYRGIKAS